MTSAYGELERRALDLVERALGVDEDRRDAFVAEAAGDDERLRRRALAILDGSSDRHLSLRTGGALERVINEAMPDEIGGYRIEAEIGRGGMGAVYLARRPDADFDHPVAIKVVRSAASNRLLERLRFERRTLARLKHPNIAQMYDGGETPDGQPFFVMEYAPGASLHDHLNGKEPTLEERLDIFRDVCVAVAYAHKNLVIHRDLSPSNILVTVEERVKLIDFGIAHSLEGSLEPDGATSNLTMTKGYAAPERADGAPASTITDIYSLGVILKDLIEGLPAPRRADLDAIARKAAAAGPEDRYPTVDALMADIAAWREGRAVAAVEKGWTYELARFVGRRKIAVGAGAFAMIAVVASSIVMSVLYLRAEQQTARAEATAVFLRDIMISADPRAPGAGYRATLRDALQRAAGFIETRFAGDPAMEVRVRDTAAEIAIGIQDFEAAVMHRRRAAELLESMRGPIDPATLKARYSLGEALMRASSFEEAGDVLDAADANAGALLEDDDALAFVAVRTRGRFYMAQVQMEPAAKQFEKAMQYLAVFAPDDAQSFHAVGLDLAQSYLRIGRQEEAVAILEKLQDDARFSGAGVTDAARAAAKLHYGAALLHSGRFAEAEPVLAAAVPALAAAFGPDSGEAAAGRENLANLYSATGRWDEALALVASARETECAAKGSEHIACIARGGNEGVVLLQLGRSEEALPKIGAARDAFTRLMGDGSPGVQVMNYYLAQSLLDMGDNDSAAALVDTLDPTQLAAGSPGEGWSARVKALEGWTLLADGRRDEGSALLETAVAEMEREGLQAWIVEPFRRALSGKGR